MNCRLDVDNGALLSVQIRPITPITPGSCEQLTYVGTYILYIFTISSSIVSYLHKLTNSSRR